MNIRGNSIGTDGRRRRTTTTDNDDDDGRRHTLNLLYYRQADRGFATSRLCTDEDGTRYFSRYIFYMVRIGTSKKGGNAPRATDKKSM